ncbi:Lrp/AsnC family transcriptional regulator [Neptunitalea lumnitzerae]|uniref:AsnC family transcriptional regulator n=1 Tax=Neptunitalea lumnitzerae TaxID=2965509 RepID=A0ABQ5MJA6_9FLAO|nr:Lrp/AsnC family transcriptional regulator [Neptunitalea sp. Y10]GLB49489.1 AsnC family transcriptional regulator [Neptunitalea sp. Y10]
MKLDNTDLRILNILQNNSAISTKELAKKLSLTTTPVYERIKKLEREGIIEKYVAIVNQKKMGVSLSAFIFVSIKEHTRRHLDKFQKDVNSFEEVTECFHITGDSDFLLKVEVKDIQAYQTFIFNKLSLITHLGSVKTQFVLSQMKQKSPNISFVVEK